MPDALIESIKCANCGPNYRWCPTCAQPRLVWSARVVPRKPRLLDLFCGAGGCSMGYSRAGFDVFGVDINPKPLRHYPFDHICADALEYCRDHGNEFDVIHASPPCQAYSRSCTHKRDLHPRLIEAVRTMLLEIGKPYVIENVEGAPIRADFSICGCHVGLPEIKRRRNFETNWPHEFKLSPPCNHPLPIITVCGHGRPSGSYHWVNKVACGVTDWRRAMGIDWMTLSELSQAIPPAYTEFIGRQLIEQLAVEAQSSDCTYALTCAVCGKESNA